MVVVRRIPMHGPDGHLHVVWQQEGIREGRQQWSARRGSQKWHIEGRLGARHLMKLLVVIAAIALAACLLFGAITVSYVRKLR